MNFKPEISLSTQNKIVKPDASSINEKEKNGLFQKILSGLIKEDGSGPDWGKEKIQVDKKKNFTKEDLLQLVRQDLQTFFTKNKVSEIKTASNDGVSESSNISGKDVYNSIKLNKKAEAGEESNAAAEKTTAGQAAINEANKFDPSGLVFNGKTDPAQTAAMSKEASGGAANKDTALSVYKKIRSGVIQNIVTLQSENPAANKTPDDINMLPKNEAAPVKDIQPENAESANKTGKKIFTGENIPDNSGKEKIEPINKNEPPVDGEEIKKAESKKNNEEVYDTKSALLLKAGRRKNASAVNLADNNDKAAVNAKAIKEKPSKTVVSDEIKKELQEKTQLKDEVKVQTEIKKGADLKLEKQDAERNSAITKNDGILFSPQPAADKSSEAKVNGMKPEPKVKETIPASEKPDEISEKSKKEVKNDIKDKETVILRHVENRESQDSAPVKTVHINRLTEEIVNQIRQNRNSFVILKLSPENLGNVTLALKFTNKKVDIHIKVESGKAEEKLNSEASGLIESLKQIGIELNDLKIDLADEKDPGKRKKGKNGIIDSAPSGHDLPQNDKLPGSKNLGYNTYDIII